jgi:uncharacterized protein
MVWLGLAYAVSIDGVVDPRATEGSYVSDMADVLDPAAEDAIDAVLAGLEADLGAQVAVVTVPSTDGDTPKAFATGLFNHWKLGQREANNGLLVLLVMDARRLEMETGYGLETTLPDAWLGRMQRERMVPRFKAGDFGGGLVEGVNALDARMRLSPEEVREGTRGAIDVAGGEGDDTLQMAAVAGGSTLAVGVLGVVGVAARRRYVRDRTCPTCETSMTMLSEVDDDDHLTEGQQMEEAIGSVNYHVYVCATCDHTRTFTRNRWFSGFSRCPACDHRTRRTSRTTLRAATEYSGGLVEITETCAHCDHHRRYTRSTPRLSSSSSSSSGGFSSGSSGGGSWGGGSSGGGGAGSSW